ncbi:MAG: TraB/GumN family protein [Saprospiraceae bacterium]
MLQKSTLLIFLILISIFLRGQGRENSLNSNTILLKISKENSEKTSYLFGTHHAFGKSFFDSLTLANQALSTCDLLIKENLDIPGEMAEDIINRRSVRTNWTKYLNREDLEFIHDLFAKSPTDYNKLTPTEMYVFLNRHFKQMVCLEKSKDDPSLTLDDYIGSLAMEQNLELLGLETTEEQMRMINQDVEGMPRKVHKKRLSGIIEILKAKNSKYCEETDWYSEMDIDYKLNEPCSNSLMLTDRNNKWMPIILERMETNNCFIAVGLSHLMYECGLIQQLQGSGYEITPIEVK